MPVYKDEQRNTWYAMFYYVDWTGARRKKKKRGFQKKKEAQEFEREFLKKETMSSDMTFASLVEVYFEDMSKRLRPTTIDNKRNIFNTKLLPSFGKLPINKIQSTHIRKWQAEMMSEGYKPTYLKTINNQLSAIFNFAVRHYGLPKNPCHAAGSMGRKKADEMQIWTLDEFKQFIAVVDKPAIRLAFLILYWSGCRSGELLALYPRDILPDKIIDISKTTTRKGGIDHFYDPKTSKSARKVTIPEFLYDEIQGYISKIWNVQPDDQIFYFQKSTLNKNLDLFAAKAGVKRIRVHDLRHSHASLLIEMGQPILLISERLGHEKVDTTWSTYAHLYPDKGIKLADELQKIGKIEPQ